MSVFDLLAILTDYCHRGCGRGSDVSDRVAP